MHGGSSTAVAPDENKSLVREFYEQWNAGAIDFERLFHRDVTNHQPDRDAEVGLELFRRAIEGVTGAVPDSRWSVLALIAEGDLVACHASWSGTYEGAVFRGVPTPRGCRFSVEHIHIYRIAESRIAEHWVVRDDLAMMQQLGAVPGLSTSAD
jgi:predicted ester cyclase